VKRILIAVGLLLSLGAILAFALLIATRTFDVVRADRPLQITLISVLLVGYILLRVAGSVGGEKS